MTKSILDDELIVVLQLSGNRTAVLLNSRIIRRPSLPYSFYFYPISAPPFKPANSTSI